MFNNTLLSQNLRLEICTLLGY